MGNFLDEFHESEEELMKAIDEKFRLLSVKIVRILEESKPTRTENTT